MSLKNADLAVMFDTHNATNGGAFELTWKLPAVGFIAATYWQSLMFCTVSFDVAYLNDRYSVARCQY